MWALEDGEHGEYQIRDVGADKVIASLFCSPEHADCLRYLIARANEGNAAHVAKLEAAGELETATARST
jgi:hypothetical protein